MLNFIKVHASLSMMWCVHRTASAHAFETLEMEYSLIPRVVIDIYRSIKAKINQTLIMCQILCYVLYIHYYSKSLQPNDTATIITSTSKSGI